MIQRERERESFIRINEKEKWVHKERERERERESCIKINERTCAYVGWGNNKKIEKIDYLNKGGDKIDELIWVFCKSECVK